MSNPIAEAHAIATGIITAQLRTQGWDKALTDKFVGLMAHHQRLLIDAMNEERPTGKVPPRERVLEIVGR